MFILLSIIFMISAFYFMYRFKKDIIASMFFSIIFGVIAFICFFCICYEIDSFLSKNNFEEHIINKYEISSMKSSSSFHGDFFLGTGQINSKLNYIFFAKNNNMFEQKIIPIDGVLINQSNNEKPNVTKKIYKAKTSWWNWPIKELMKENIITIITVPEGTIIQKYILE